MILFVAAPKLVVILTEYFSSTSITLPIVSCNFNLGFSKTLFTELGNKK